MTIAKEEIPDSGRSMHILTYQGFKGRAPLTGLGFEQGTFISVSAVPHWGTAVAKQQYLTVTCQTLISFTCGEFKE